MRLLLIIALGLSTPAFAESLEIRGELKNELVYKDGKTKANTEIGVSLGHEEGNIGLSLDPTNQKIKKLSGKLGNSENNISLEYGKTEAIKIEDDNDKGLSLTLNFDYFNEGFVRLDQSSKKVVCVDYEDNNSEFCVNESYVLGGGIYQAIGNGLDLSVRSRYKIPINDDKNLNESGFSIGTGVRLSSDEIGFEYFKDTEGRDIQSGIKLNYENQNSGISFGMSYYENNTNTETVIKGLDNTWGISASNKINDTTKIETGIKRRQEIGLDDTPSDYEMRLGVSFSF